MLKAKVLVVFLAIFLASGSAWSTTQEPATKQTETSGQYVNDSVITAKVKAELLANEAFKSLSISVKTNKGVVTLSGKVSNNLQKNKAISIASQVKGVKSVKDNLVVVAKKKK